MDPKFYPIPKLSGLTIDQELETTLCSGLILPAEALRGDLTFMQDNYAEIKDKLHCISLNNPCIKYALRYWKEHEMPPAAQNVCDFLEQNGSEDGLAFYKNVMGLIQNPDGTPKKNSIPATYSFAGRVSEAIKQTTRNYVQYISQKSFELYASGVTVEVGTKKETLIGTDDYVSYLTYALNNIPVFRNLKNTGNSYMDASTLNYIAYPYFALGDTTVLVGPSTSGKTMSILDSMTSTEIGSKIFGRLEVMQNHHIQLFTELSKSSIKERLQGINKVLDTTKTIIYCRPETGEIPDYQLFFTKMVQYTEIPKLIYVDNISSWTNVDVCKDKDMSQMHTFFRNLAIVTNSCFVLLCHTRKRSNNRREWGEKQLDDIAGSRLLYSLADAVLLFDEVIDEKKKRVRGWTSIDFFKRKELTRSYFNLDECVGVINYFDDLPPGLLGSTSDEELSPDMIILQVIQDAQRPVNSKYIEEATKIHRKTIRRALNVLKINDKIFQCGKDNAPNITYVIRERPRDKPPEGFDFGEEIPILTKESV